MVDGNIIVTIYFEWYPVVGYNDPFVSFSTVLLIDCNVFDEFPLIGQFNLKVNGGYEFCCWQDIKSFYVWSRLASKELLILT